MTLNLDFRVLFPATNISRHVVEHDFFLEELVHLALNGVFISSSNKGCSIVNASHRVEVFVLTGIDSANSEIIIEQVLAMAPVWYTIVDKKLENNFNGSLAMEAKIFSVAGNNLTIALQTLLDGSAIAALVLNKTLGSNIDDMVSCGLS